MKKVLLSCLVMTMFGFNLNCYGEEESSNQLPVIEPPPVNSCEQVNKTDIKKDIKGQQYDNIPIFNQSGDKKINFYLRQPSANLGTQQ